MEPKRFCAIGASPLCCPKTPSPPLRRLWLWGRRKSNSMYGKLEMAERFHCTGVQFWLGMFDETTIQTLHEKGIRCNLFYADTEQDYETYFSMGIDTLLTNRMDRAAAFRENNKNHF